MIPIDLQLLQEVALPPCPPVDAEIPAFGQSYYWDCRRAALALADLSLEDQHAVACRAARRRMHEALLSIGGLQ